METNTRLEQIAIAMRVSNSDLKKAKIDALDLTVMSSPMEEISCFAFCEIQKLPTLVMAFSILPFPSALLPLCLERERERGEGMCVFSTAEPKGISVPPRSRAHASRDTAEIVKLTLSDVDRGVFSSHIATFPSVS